MREDASESLAVGVTGVGVKVYAGVWLTMEGEVVVAVCLHRRA